jgi:hypothetical protein
LNRWLEILYINQLEPRENLMRLRITTGPPLEPLKSLVAVPRILLDDDDATIYQLKQHFCRVLSCLTTYGPENISISVEGFDVLDFNPLSVLHDGDLLLLVCFDNLMTTSILTYSQRTQGQIARLCQGWNEA